MLFNDIEFGGNLSSLNRIWFSIKIIKMHIFHHKSLVKAHCMHINPNLNQVDQRILHCGQQIVSSQVLTMGFSENTLNMNSASFSGSNVDGTIT